PAASHVHWVRPSLVAEVEYGAWSRDGILRDAAFLGLRDDKEPKDVCREAAVRPPEQHRKNADSPSESSRPPPMRGPAGDTGRLSNPDRVLFHEACITKADLAAYYESIADWILPPIVHRPRALLRCPEGRQRECFFQRPVGRNMAK